MRVTVRKSPKLIASPSFPAHSDQQIDVGVIVGLYAIFVIVEVIRMPMAWREARRPQAGGAGEEDKVSV